ncbi:MAG: undecaprenyl-diphosphate phosphatase [Myxococcota bacterium]
MTVTQALALGALQGVTEFLPVSSDGHLVVAQHAMGLGGSELIFDLVVHGGTLIALLAFFNADLFRLSRRQLRDLAVATIVTAAIALPFKALMERTYAYVVVAGIGFLVTGCALFSTRRARGDRVDVGLAAAALIGAAQALAPLPGISRSGMTIAAALLLGVRRDEAARFGFLLAIPAIAGALVLELGHPPAGGTASTGALLAGAAVAALVGYAALRFALGVVARGGVHRFAYYLWPLGTAVILWSTFTH